MIRFAEVGILDLLLVIGSNSMEADVAEWNVIILEILYNILRHVRPRDVFALNEEQSEVRILVKYHAFQRGSTH